MAVALASRTPGLTAADVLERGAATVADWYVVPAPPSAEQTHSVLVHAGSTLAGVVAGDPDDSVWIVDAGRLSVHSPAMPFAREADHVVVVTGGSFPALQLVPSPGRRPPRGRLHGVRRRRRTDVVAARRDRRLRRCRCRRGPTPRQGARRRRRVDARQRVAIVVAAGRRPRRVTSPSAT